MKIEGLEFMDWLHKIRKNSEKERKKEQISGINWLKMIYKQTELSRLKIKTPSWKK